jgi:hypothetical protein
LTLILTPFWTRQADKGRNDMNGIFGSIIKKFRGIIQESALTALSDSRTSNDINRNNIVEQLIDFCMSNSIETPIAQIPYDPSSVVGLETIRTAVSVENYQIDLAICKKSKIIFFNSKKIRSLVDEGILNRHVNDWATFLRIVYDCGLKVSLVDTANGKLLPFQKYSG